jgi:hypothetical protein
MNTNIPMGFQPTNVLAMMDAGTQAGARMGEVQQRGRLLNAYREHGAGVLSGDPNAMNALAAIDLPQAMDFRGQNQAYRINEETLQMRRASGAREAQRFAAEMDAAEVAQTREMIGRGLATAIPALRSGDMETVNQIFRTAGLPAAETPQQAAEVIATYEGAMEFFNSSQEVLGNTETELTTANQTLMQRAEMLNLVEGTPAFDEFIRNNGRIPEGMRLETRPDGTAVFVQGPGVGQEDPNGFSRVDPASPSSMVNSIDGILNDPALDFATGWLEWTQRLPGGPTTRFGTRAAQLDGQAFLQAYNSLRGGGQITEAEGSRALAAIGRLDTAQSAQDYREALIELRNIIVTGTARPQGWATSQDSDGGVGVPFEPGGGIPTISSPQEAQSLPPGTVFYDPQGNLREVPRQ